MSNKSQKTPVFNSDKELADFLLSNLSDSLKQAIRITVKIMIKQEMEDFRKGFDEKLSFNGYYQRNMTSPIGSVSDINIARFRERPIEELALKSLSVFDQEKERFFQLVAEMHRLGISQRKIKNLCHNCLGIKISANKVGLVHKELAEQESLQINSQPIANDFEYLLLDGVWVKCKNWGLKTDNKMVLLCALGIRPDGTRKIIGFTMAEQEDFNSWDRFIVQMKERGLSGDNLKLIIADDNGGLRNSLNHLFSNIKRQICVTHKMRNVINKTRHKNKKAVISDLQTIYNSETPEEALKHFKQFAKTWYVAEPQAVESLRFNFEETITYLSFSKDLWKKIRTSNILEREFREVRRRIKVFDNSFNNEKSLMNYGNTIFDYLNNHYPASLHTKS